MTVMRFPSTPGTYLGMAAGAGALIAALDISIALNGWIKVYDNGSNTVVYQSTDTSTHQRYIQVKDTELYIAEIRGYRSMTDAITGTYSFPDDYDPTILYIVKHNAVFAQPSKNWAVVCDADIFYFWIDPDSTAPTNPTTAGIYCFGDFVTRKVDDNFNTIIIGATGTPAGVAPSRTLANTAENFHSIANSRAGFSSAWNPYRGHYVAGASSQIGRSLWYNVGGGFATSGVGKHSDLYFGNSETIGIASLPYPNSIRNLITPGALTMGPVYVSESYKPNSYGDTSFYVTLRGSLQGIWAPAHTKPIAHKDVFQGDGLTLSGTKEFEAFNLQGGQVMIETSDTWYT